MCAVLLCSKLCLDQLVLITAFSFIFTLLYGISRVIDNLTPLLIELNQHMERNLIPELRHPVATAQPPPSQGGSRLSFSLKPDSTNVVNNKIL